MIKKNSGIFTIAGIVIIYLIVNVLFNFNIWKQVVIPDSGNTLAIQGESFIYEYFAEVVRTNILSGKNPFTPAEGVMFPFGWDFSADDIAPINGLYFVFLRPFLSMHQSLMLIVVTSIFLSNISMYWFLRLLRVQKWVAFLGGLIFGFSPFISVRSGAHPSYTSLYLFPLLCIFFLLVNQSFTKKGKIVSAFALGVIAAITVLTNFYYALMIVIMFCLFIGYFLFFEKKIFFQYIRQNYTYLCIAGISTAVLLSPWFIKVYEFFSFNKYVKPQGIHDAVFYSADMFGIFVPSRLNPFYKPFLQLLAQKIPHMIKIFETFIYPGIIIIMGYVLIIAFYRKIPPGVKRIMSPFFFISIAFWVLSLGPYLHIFGKELRIPLPYLFLTKLPLFQMARAPARFIMPFIFLASVAVSFFIQYMFQTHRKKTVFFAALLFFIFIIDQSYTVILPQTYNITYPARIYDYLKKNNTGPLFEIPFAVRDGLKNLGNFYAVFLPRTQLIHNQPSFGIYGGRINDETFAYFKNNPLIGSFAKLIDRDAKQYAKIISEFDIKNMDTAIDFFGISHAVLKNDEPYSLFAKITLERLGFSPVQTENNFILFYRKPENSIIHFKLNSENDYLFLEQGWGEKEEKGRWALGRLSTLVFKSAPDTSYHMSFTARSFAYPQIMDVYVNKKKIQTFEFGTAPISLTLPLTTSLQPGFNLITLKFKTSTRPSSILKNNTDTRSLSAFFSDFTISSQ